MEGLDMVKHTFFYDESEHSRKISYETIKAENFEPNFVVAIVGCPTDLLGELENKYNELEKYYKSFYSVDELKSEIVKEKKYKYGLKSFKKNDLNLIKDIFSFLYDNNFKVYISVYNKIEFIINQLLKDYENDLFIDADLFRYVVTKMLNVYFPRNLIKSIYHDINNFKNELRKFCLDLLTKNKNLPHKEIENEAINQLLIILDETSNDFKINWDYTFAFSGFKSFINENRYEVSTLYIDKEGSGNTYSAAIEEGFLNSLEIDSTNNFGVRLADFVAGTISRFIISIANEINYSSINDSMNLKLLSNMWFDLNKETFVCYKILKKVFVDLNKSWFKFNYSHYTDHFLYFVTLLNYFDKYNDFESYLKDRNVNHSLELNNLALEELFERFNLIRSKLKIEPITTVDQESYINQKGAICYLDYKKHGYLPINEGHTKYHVLSVGFFGNNEKACATIQTEKGPVLYLLPDQLMSWSFDMVAYANMGIKLFPSDVIFTLVKGKYYVDLD